jgi:NitT/TauT family transport system permease protein
MRPLEASAAVAGGRTPRLAARRRQRTIWVGRAVFLLLFVLLWQLASPHLDPTVFASPAAILRSLAGQVAGGTLWPNLLVTLEEIVLGYVLGAAGGVVLGFLLGASPVAAGILEPVVMAVYGIPKIALGPLFVVWFGINLMPKVVMAGVIVFFVVFLATYHGVREVDEDLVRSVRLLGLNDAQVRRWVVMPGSASSIFLGLKMAVPEALVGAIVGEMIVSNSGIGYLIQFAATQLDTPGVYAGLLVLTVMALAANAVVNKASGTTSRHRKDG